MLTKEEMAKSGWANHAPFTLGQPVRVFDVETPEERYGDVVEIIDTPKGPLYRLSNGLVCKGKQLVGPEEL